MIFAGNCENYAYKIPNQVDMALLKNLSTVKMF